MQQQPLRCPNCGSTMETAYLGEMMDKHVVCKACGTMFDVPDSYQRVRRTRTRRKGILRRKEVVEEVTELRSDQAPAPPPPRPQVFYMPLHLPGRRQQSSDDSGGCVAAFLVLLALGIIAVLAFVFLNISSSESDSELDNVSQSISFSSSGTVSFSSSSSTTTTLICSVTPASSGVIIRDEPSTDSARAGRLAVGEVALVDGYVRGDDDFRWWRLMDESGWVREDVVLEDATCVGVAELE